MPAEDSRQHPNKAESGATHQAKNAKIDGWMKQEPKEEPWNAIARAVAAQSLAERRTTVL
jgi:hypothetical protein